MDELEALRDKPRSERISVLFDWDPFDYQQELIDGTTKEVYKAAVKPGRQVGKTETGGAIGGERALTGHDVMILGPFQDTVKEMMEAAKGHLLNAEEKFSQAGFSLGTEKRNQFEWDFQNGGRLRARTVGSDGTQIRGKNPDIVLVDEAAYIKDSIFTEVIEPFFSTHDSYEFYLFSTPAGKSGYFYDAVDGQNESEWYSPHWPSEISPLISTDFLERKQEELDSTTYAQEYLGEFVDEGDTLFDIEDIRALDTPEELHGDVFLGVDVAREGKDRTVYAEVDEFGNVNIADSEETSTVDGVLGRIKDLHNERGYASIIVEENSMGGGVVDFGQYDLSDVIQPFKSSTKSKHQLYKRLQKDIENKDLALPEHRNLIDELTSLKYEFTQHGYMKTHHPNGGHDDFADSVAFANWGRTEGSNVTRRKARVSMHKGR